MDREEVNTKRCPECGGETIRQYRWVGGHGHVRVRSCLNQDCMWGEFLDKEMQENQARLQAIAKAKLANLAGEG